MGDTCSTVVKVRYVLNLLIGKLRKIYNLRVLGKNKKILLKWILKVMGLRNISHRGVSYQ
jgi:hypothetical protein